jgi:DNA modification methylase
MIHVITGDCRDVLATMPAESVHCVVTSPPYFGLRDYGIAGQIGLEPTMEEYVSEMVGVFREVRRVLRSDGTLWLNLGDSYSAQGGGKSPGLYEDKRPDAATWQAPRKPTDGLKQKDLCGIPWRVAFALQADGWYLRQDIIWAKPNPMPESVTDRCTKAHESMLIELNPTYVAMAEYRIRDDAPLFFVGAVTGAAAGVNALASGKPSG